MPTITAQPESPWASSICGIVFASDVFAMRALSGFISLESSGVNVAHASIRATRLLKDSRKPTNTDSPTTRTPMRLASIAQRSRATVAPTVGRNTLSVKLIRQLPLFVR